MEILIKLTVDVDGGLDISTVPSIIMERVNFCQVLLSEDYDGTEDWAIEINSAELVSDEGKIP